MGAMPADAAGRRGALIQVVRADQDHLSMVAPLVATYWGTRPAPMTLALHELGSTFDPRRSPKLRAASAVSSISRDGDTLLDNMPYELAFPSIPKSKGKFFALVVSSDLARDDAPTVWLSDGPERVAGHVACFQGDAPQGDFGLQARLGYAPVHSPHRVPRHLLYSPYTQCNLNCVHCVSRDTRKQASRLPASMKDDIASWCRNGWIETIATDYSGDILWADARFGGELDFLFGLDVPLAIDTNGAHLTPEVSRRLMASRMMSMNISIDTPDPETYRWIRKGAPPLAVILDNVRGAVAARAEAAAQDRIRLSLSFTIMRSTIDQWEDFIRLAADLGIGTVWCRHLEVYTADLEHESMWHEKSRHNEVQARVQDLAARLGVQAVMQGPFENVRPGGGKRWCDAAWNSAVILGNGDVQVCCMPKTKIGNLHETPMEDLWMGPRYQAFRAAVNSAEPPAPCQVCPMYRQANNESSYFPHRRLATSQPPVSWELPPKGGASETGIRRVAQIARQMVGPRRQA